MAYTMEDLLSVLHPHCPVKVDALSKNRRRVEHGLTTVGLKIHCLGDNHELLNLIDALGGRSEVIANRFYAHARASVSVILPPVGSARSAILLLECIEKYFGHLSLLKISTGLREAGDFHSRPYRQVMVTILFAVVSILVFRFRSRAALELKLVALQHQLAVLRRQRPGRPQLSSWISFYGCCSTGSGPGHRRDGTGQARNRGRVASQGLPVLLALAITSSGTAQDQSRNP